MDCIYIDMSLDIEDIDISIDVAGCTVDLRESVTAHPVEVKLTERDIEYLGESDAVTLLEWIRKHHPEIE